MACDVQTLLDANPCLTALNPQELEAVKTALLCRIKERIAGGPLTDCDIEDLLEEGKCYVALPAFVIRNLQTQLVLDIAGYVGIPALPACFAALSPAMLALVITALYCRILEVLDGAPPFEDCDIQTLLDESACYAVLDAFLLSRIQAGLICAINEVIVDPPTPPVCTLAITTEPSNFTGDEGSDFTLTVGWSGAVGTPTVQWQRDDGGAGWINVIDGEFEGTVASGAQTPTLSITNAKLATAGDFRAIVTDPAITACTATSATAVVTINALAGNNLLTGLLAYYRFEEENGNALDSSGNNRTLNEEVGTIFSSPDGVVEKCREYSTSQLAHFENASSAFNALPALTLSAWCKFNNRAFDPNDMTIVAKGDYLLGSLAWWLLFDHANPTDLLTFYWTEDGSNLQSVTFDTGAVITDGTFYFVCLRWDGTTFRLSFTAESESAPVAPTTAAFAGSFYSTADPLVVGGMPGSSIHYMGGLIDELAIYNRSLSDCEVAALFTAKAGTFTYAEFNANPCI